MSVMTEEKRPRIGISSCLLGEKVRYDGGHKLDMFLVKTLGQFVDYIPVCPEVETGFSTPREAFRLVGDIGSPRLMTQRSGVDHTDTMKMWASKRLDQLEPEKLCGFIFKSRSPSSGMERVKVYNEKGHAERKGVGIFARAFMERFPVLPVEEEGRLHDPALRENFIERVFVYQRLRDLRENKPDRGKVVEFHTRHKLLIRAHGEKHYSALGAMIARIKEYDSVQNFLLHYETELMNGLSMRCTVRKQVNVLMHILGYFKRNLSSDEKQEVLETIEYYRNSLVPLIVPVTLFNHFVRKYQQVYLTDQYYLHPHPLELQLRNHV